MKNLPTSWHVMWLLWMAFSNPSFSQKKVLSQQDIHRWRKVEQEKLSNNGRWVAYVLESMTDADPILQVWDSQKENVRTFERGTQPIFTFDNNYLIFKVKPSVDTLKKLRRRKVKDEDLPKDTLAVLHLPSGMLQKMERVKNFTVPEKWSGHIIFELETALPDTSAASKAAAKKAKKEGKDNGWRLVVRDLATARHDTLPFVKEFALAKRAPRLLVHTTGRDSTLAAGIYFFDFSEKKLTPIFQKKGKFQKLNLDEWGRQAVFLTDIDTSKAQIRPWQLGFWQETMSTAELLSQRASAQFLFPDEKTTVSEHARPQFSEDGKKLFFGIAPPPFLPDTTRLPEEIVNLEIWNWKDDYIYPMQKKRHDAEKKRSHPVVFRIDEGRFVAIGSEELPNTRFTPSRDAEWALAFTEKPYSQELIWNGNARQDVFAVDLKNGDKKLIIKGLSGSPQISPAGKYAYWYSRIDSSWWACSTENFQTRRLTNAQISIFYDELNDVPDHPDAYGMAAWTAGDESLILYDRYDLWQFDPSGNRKPKRLTDGRASKTVFRYLRLDAEERFISPDAEILLHRFQETDKTEGYDWLDLTSERRRIWLGGNFSYSKNPVKAKNSWEILFRRENFEVYPDLLFASQGKIKQVSRANPQQSEYAWGSIELVEWTALDGQRLQGMLVKPPNFDPRKKYPMVVNFYERSSDGLLKHRAPDAHRSQINYSIFASKGYLIFNPDIPYRTGYPGESAVNAVLSGVSALVQKGFVDKQRIGLQGHSWGGYQAAYLVTKTNIFACAEAGAPVVNMFSAYGGIRWESGRSRIFQYEHQQSRIGGSIWEYPLRYLENSPLFFLDKVQTPVLILHNDQDGAVPWYQGIEFYMGLVRLGKKTWLLNYNDEPHWPVKLQNRLDFQSKMEQFFDHYLMNQPMPNWMEKQLGIRN